MNLTIGITCYYGTKLAKLINQINSLFDPRFTPSLRSLIEPSMDIVPNEKIELIFVIDTYEIRNKYIPKKYTQTYEENINNILTYIKSLKIYNTKISIFKTEYNSGVSVSRNIIINNAKSKFLCFCDDDDLHINVNETLKITMDPVVSSDILGIRCGSLVDGFFCSSSKIFDACSAWWTENQKRKCVVHQNV